MDNAVQIRALIDRWVHAVQDRDLDGVLAEHTDDVVMFDVPPPEKGARGIDEYRKTWPQFFHWLERGAVFELESLDVTAGDDVAFAYALLRCATPEDMQERPNERLRLTIGLRKEDSRWLIAHEHHSYPARS
jgi:uncharacterized protein (TIGR02246 family)